MAGVSGSTTSLLACRSSITPWLVTSTGRTSDGEGVNASLAVTRYRSTRRNCWVSVSVSGRRWYRPATVSATGESCGGTIGPVYHTGPYLPGPTVGKVASTDTASRSSLSRVASTYWKIGQRRLVPNGL